MVTGYAYLFGRAAVRLASPYHLPCCVITVRPGAIVKSSSYYGNNEALLYRDVALRLVRDPVEPSQTVLLMEVLVRLWKGYREKGKP